MNFTLRQAIKLGFNVGAGVSAGIFGFTVVTFIWKVPFETALKISLKKMKGEAADDNN